MKSLTIILTAIMMLFCGSAYAASGAAIPGPSTVTATMEGTTLVGDGDGPLTVDGNVNVGGFVSIAGDSTVVQANPENLNVAAHVYADGTAVTSANPLPITTGGIPIQVSGTLTTGSITLSGDTTVVQAVRGQMNVNSSLQIQGVDVGAGNPVPISDNAGSVTVDDGGTPLDVNAAQSGVWNLNSIVAAVSVDDNLSSLTVDSALGALDVAQSGVWNIGTVTTLTSIANPVSTVPTTAVSAVNAPSTDTDIGAVNAKSVKGSPGNVFSVAVSSTGNNAWLLLHDKATAPIATDVPKAVLKVPNNGQVLFGTDFFTDAGMYFATGIAWCYSSTRNTCTLNTAAEQFTVINYK